MKREGMEEDLRWGVQIFFFLTYSPKVLFIIIIFSFF